MHMELSLPSSLLCIFCCPPDIVPYASVCSASIKARWLDLCEAPWLCSLEKPLGYELGNCMHPNCSVFLLWTEDLHDSPLQLLFSRESHLFDTCCPALERCYFIYLIGFSTSFHKEVNSHNN